MTLSDSLDRFTGRKILIIGDVMLDRYLYGKVSRISPEAPVPVLDFEKTDNRLGGAANVALNVVAMGGKVSLVGVVGKDEEGSVFRNLMVDAAIDDIGIIIADGRNTTLKTRVMAGSHHLLRVDREDKGPMDKNIEAQVMSKILDQIDYQTPEGIILQDYNKGLFSKNIIQKTIKQARQKNIPVFVDPKNDHIAAYSDCTVFKPNLQEAEKIIGQKIQVDNKGLNRAAESLQKIVGHDVTLITLSDKGLFIKEKQGSGHWIPSVPQDVADVCGAGDSVISALALSYLTRTSTEKMAKIANIAGHVACRYPGVVPVELAQLVSEIS